MIEISPQHNILLRHSPTIMMALKDTLYSKTSDEHCVVMSQGRGLHETDQQLFGAAIFA